MATLRSYDELPYLSRPYPQTHPDRLAVLGTLCGMTPEPVERSRVLELGCGRGGNLIPMALAYPEGQFLGIDLSERQVRDGLQVVEQLGLQNIEIRHGDILEFDGDDAQPFDVIIAHGVYSWVPPQVREHLLKLMKANLAPQGLAYVSFNTTPGWSLRTILRDLILSHGGDDRCPQARALFEHLEETLRTRTDPHSVQLRDLVAELNGYEDWYLRHDLLGDVNDPVAFQAFHL
jgi:SAM-dependent methyltransferase